MNIRVNLSKFKLNDHPDFTHAEEIEVQDADETIDVECDFYHDENHRRKKQSRPSNNHNPLMSMYNKEGVSFGECQYQNIMNAIELLDGDYGIQVDFLTGENHGIYQLIGFEIEVTVLNSRFITYLLFMRYFLCIVSTIAFFLYRKGLKKIQPRQITFEHRFIKVLALSLIFLNDPFAIMNTKYPNFLTYLFQLTTLGLLLLELVKMFMVSFSSIFF